MGELRDIVCVAFKSRGGIPFDASLPSCGTNAVLRCCAYTHDTFIVQKVQLMVETPRSLQAFRSGGEAGMSGGSKPRSAATKLDQSTTLEGREFLARVDVVARQLVSECKANPEKARDLLKSIGAPQRKRKS